MDSKKNIVVVILFALSTSFINSQNIELPNYALKKIETLIIKKIVLSPAKTSVYFSIENRIAGGQFCADKNIFVIYPDGTRIRMTASEGIPACPDSFKFKAIGEKLDFVLTFPPLKANTKWIDIIEDCQDNCFWFYGVTLDVELNKRLDEAFLQASKGKPEDNILTFKNLLDSIDAENQGIEGMLYLNIINAAIENGDKVNERVWYKRLSASHAPRVDQYIKYLNDKGIKY